MTHRAAWSTALAALVAVAASSCSETTGVIDRGSNGSSGHPSSSSSGPATAAGTQGTSIGGTSGTSGAATTGGTSGSNGGNVCGINAELCNGACVITLDDPNNCGGCGIACGSGSVCLDGVCDTPLACVGSFLIPCGDACVDPLTDNQNCGLCGHACTGDTGCSTGFCVPTIALTGQTPSCPNGGPPTTVISDAGSMCTGNLAQISFRWALCSCDDVQDNGLVYTDSFDSLYGPYIDGGLGGSLGSNSDMTLYGAFWVGGALWTDSTSGFDVAGGAHIGLELHDNGPFTAYGLAGVGSNAFINGNVNAYGFLSIAGTLNVPSGASVTPVLVSAASTVTAPVTVPPPCDCSASQLIDVASIVAYGATNNDDAVIGLNPDAMNNSALISGQRLDLPCGNYYLSAIKFNGTATLAIHGHTALFVGGDVSPNGGIELALDPQATLDLFIGGNLTINGETSLGSTLTPSQARIYVAGSQVSYNGNLTLSGNFYTPYADVAPNGNLTVYGSLFAGNYQSNGTTELHYDSAILSAGRECEDAGAPTGMCGSCRDCGNQACINGTCGSCASSADCCAPLVCVNGSCTVKFE